MSEKFCVLFDMDGVILDTETQYTSLWKQINKLYGTGIVDLEVKIKGTTLPNILTKYFAHLSDSEVQDLINYHFDFEKTMTFPQIPGALDFINELRRNGIKIGMVTSSNNAKLELVYKELDLRNLFNTIVSDGRVTKGKPDPMCYLLGAQDLGYAPSDCFVFEDALSGIAAGNAAGMKVIGLSTTNSRDLLVDLCLKVIPDFRGFTLNELKQLT